MNKDFACLWRKYLCDHFKQKHRLCTNVLRAMSSTKGLKYPGMPSFSDQPGKIYILDLLLPKSTPVEMQIMGDLDLSSFNPHGISVYIDDTSETQI